MRGRLTRQSDSLLSLKTFTPAWYRIASKELHCTLRTSNDMDMLHFRWKCTNPALLMLVLPTLLHIALPCACCEILIFLGF